MFLSFLTPSVILLCFSLSQIPAFSSMTFCMQYDSLQWNHVQNRLIFDHKPLTQKDPSFHCMALPRYRQHLVPFHSLKCNLYFIFIIKSIVLSKSKNLLFAPLKYSHLRLHSNEFSEVLHMSVPLKPFQCLLRNFIPSPPPFP